MKLPDHVDKLRLLIEAAFDKQFARLGIGKVSMMDVERLPEQVRGKRPRYEAILESHIGETGDYEHAREKLIDELTFTLFNRLAAVKVMEAANLFPPILTKQPEHGDRSFGHKAWLEENPDMRSEELEGIREYIKSAFNELGETLPLYSKQYPYALLPDAISLNEIIDTFNEVEKDDQVGIDIWQSDDVLGWMYESYNNAKKAAHKESKDKTEYNKVSLQSQVYTPRWVVQFLVENSLGKLYLEMYPDSEIKDRFKIANAPKAQERKPKPLHEVSLIDPACGSGNFLLYAFDFFYALYMDQIENYGADYDEKDIPKLIIENNLNGIDLDDRAVQLAQLGLYIKAKKKRRTIGELNFKVVSSDFYLPEYPEVQHIFETGTALDQNQKDLIREVWGDLRYAYKFGSLVRLDEKVKSKIRMLEGQLEIGDGDLFTNAFLEQEQDFSQSFFGNLKTAVEKYESSKDGSFLAGKARDAITFLAILSTEHDVAATNPPYTDSSDFGPDLKTFINANYKKPFKFHINLYATFIKRCYELTSEYGKVAMVHPPTFMYIKTFEDVRKFILDKMHIDLFVEWGFLGMFNQKVRVDASMYILNKQTLRIGSTFIKLNHIYEGKRYEEFVESYNNLLEGKKQSNSYTLPQSKLKIIKSCPFIYWVSDEFRMKFEGSLLSDVAHVAQGIATSNNNRFLRFWWEIKEESISKVLGDNKKWISFIKGGPFRKWFGNNWLCINWEDDGKDIKAFTATLPQGTHVRLKSREYYFKEGITYSALGGTGMSFRHLPSNSIFDVGGSCIFLRDNKISTQYCLSFLNSKLTTYTLSCLNPTINTQVYDIKRLPFISPSQDEDDSFLHMVDLCSKIMIELSSFSFLEKHFNLSPFLHTKSVSSIDERIRSFLSYENHRFTKVIITEAIMNEKIFGVYNLTEHDKAMVLESEGESIGGFPVLPEARDAYLAEEGVTNELSLDIIREFIELLPTREFTIEELEAIESRFPSLYQSNNDLEAFCIRNQINPINVWYWFKQSNVIPQQRMRTLAMEFLADMIREILMEDEDGVIPLVPNAGEKVLLGRIEDKFRDKGFSAAQYSSFDSVLGRPIHEYLNQYFFAELSDHLNLFLYLPKTPFIWHLSSGPEQGFDCYIIIYKWSRDKLMRLRSVYIEHRERSLVNRQSDLSGNDSADAQNEKDLIFRQLKEIESFKEKIDKLLAEGYNPILDDGVGKNIAPLQKKKMIPYDVLNAGQLKKYLNADW